MNRKLALSHSTIMVLCFGALYFIWGSTYLAIRISMETMPPFMLLGLRFGVAGLVMYVWLRLRGSDSPSFTQWRSAFTVGGLMLCVGTGSVAWAIQHIPSGLAALLITTVPLWMVLLDWLWKKGPRPSLIFFGGFVLGLVGILVLFDSTSDLSGYQANGWAIFGVLVGAVCWSAGSLHGRGANLPADPFMSTALQMTGGGILLLLVGFLSGETPWIPLEALSLRSIAAWVYLLVFGSFIAFSAFIWLMRNTSPARVSTYAYVNPVVALYLGWAFAGEPITTRILMASMLLVSAVVVVIRFSPKYAKIEGDATVETQEEKPDDSRGSSVRWAAD